MPAGHKAPKLILAVGARDHSQGSPTAQLVFLEYGDYQCPYCGAAYPVIKQVQEEFGEQLRFVFRNFPLTNAHPFAEWAAELAEGAAVQGKFWEVHDFLYENQDRLGEEAYFAQYEKKLGLDSAKLRREVAAHVHLPRIQEDFESGVRSGVNGTPTFYINGVRHDGAPDYESLVAALKEAAKRTDTK
jgi:protein-disulfide isomerase